MSDKRKRQNLFTKAKESLDFWAETVILEFTEELSRIMQETGVTGAQLAERIGTSPAYVSKVLNGNANVSLATMNKFARAFKCAVHIHLADERAVVNWSDRPSQHIPQEPEEGVVEFTAKTYHVVTQEKLPEGNTIFILGEPSEHVLQLYQVERLRGLSVEADEPEATTRQDFTVSNDMPERAIN